MSAMNHNVEIKAEDDEEDLYAMVRFLSKAMVSPCAARQKFTSLYLHVADLRRRRAESTCQTRTSCTSQAGKR